VTSVRRETNSRHAGRQSVDFLARASFHLADVVSDAVTRASLYSNDVSGAPAARSRVAERDEMDRLLRAHRLDVVKTAEQHHVGGLSAVHGY